MPDAAFQLEEFLLQNLRAGRWAPGQKLPTERELGDMFALGRTAVRGVLGGLKARGLIAQKVGSGTFVSPDAPALLGELAAAPAAAFDAISPAQLMEAWLLFEPVTADLVVRNATAADFARMDECCSEAEAAGSLQQFEYWDAALHQAIAAAAHNGFVDRMFDAMTLARQHDDWGQLKRRSLTPERRAAYQREHRVLVAALRDRDAALAAECMREHLLHVRRNLLGS